MISDEDASQMVRLLGETAALPSGHGEKKRFLMDGLCRLIDAKAWIWTLGTWEVPGSPPAYAGIMHGGFDEESFVSFLKALEHPDNEKICARWIEEVTQEHKQVTASLSELDVDHIIPQSGMLELMQAADINELLVSGYPVAENSMSAIGLYRGEGKGEFSTRDKAIAHLILKEIPWLHTAGWPEAVHDKLPHLSPQQRVVLNLLLDGHGRKQIGHQMELAENTVAGYIKDIYRHFKVNSHAQLMCKFIAGNDYEI
jgi:DNA-binding NarL/FixJ family response regulator